VKDAAHPVRSRICLLLLVAAISLIVGSGSAQGALFSVGLAQRLDRHGSTSRSDRSTTFAGSHARFFSASSPWNSEPAAGASLEPASRRMVGALVHEVRAEQAQGDGPWINTRSYSVPIYTVGASQPTVAVKLPRPQAAPALAEAFAKVPLPANAQASPGTDGHLVVWQPATDRLWEFWRFSRGAEGAQAAWGGAIADVSASSGVYGTGPGAWPGTEPDWGASASSLSIAGGLITFEDLKAGQINHALAIALPEIRAGAYAAPAQRGDGSSDSPSALPEGAHLRLDPHLDIASLGLPPLTRMIAEAAQRYGIYVRDGSAEVQFFGQEPTVGQADPWTGVGGALGGRYPNQLLASFPWQDLEVLRMEMHAE
jgi:hypothetical protein